MADSSVDDEIQMMFNAQADMRLFEPLYKRYFPRIYLYCLRRVGEAKEAEDLTSQVFTRVLTGLKDYRGGMVAAWIFRIARNTLINYHRTSYVEPVSIEHEEIDIADSEVELLDGIIFAEEQHVLRELVEELPEDQRDLLALKISGGLTSEEIGTVVGKSASAVRVQLHRLMKQLREGYLHRMRK